MGLPAGVIACVFTDIEGSTRLLRRLGEDYDALLQQHYGILRRAWAEHAGQEVGTTGDGSFVVFARVEDALRAAVAAQRALGAATWPAGLAVRVRIGVHAGYARPVGDGYSALVVHQAARIVGAAHGGQVLASGAAVRALVTPPDACDIALEPLGRFRVRDFDEPVELHAVRAAGLAVVRAAPRVRPADGHNLVRPTSSLVAGEEQVARLRGRVVPGTLTTVLGPGGVGKTRLAIETALAVAADWQDGAWFVDLAPLAAPELVRGAIADAVGAPALLGVERWAEALDHLAQRKALVVLDNCEHLVGTAAQAAGELLAACPGVAVLATSRIPLGLRSEQVHRLAPLAADGPDADAVALFVDRAATLVAPDRVQLAALCEELDGLPLAIELAAARSTAVAPVEILSRLRRSSSLLHSRDPTLPERQRSLERLLDWSAELLAPAARTVLGRLTAFGGSFDLDAAEAVGAGADLRPAEVDELLWALVDASLVTNESAAGATRYRLLSTVRAYAVEHADADDRAAAITRAARLYRERLGPERATGRAWVTGMATELDNVRWAATHVADAGVAQALAWSVGRYHDATDAFRTGIDEVSRWLALLPAPTPERVALLTLLADLHLRVAELEAADELLVEATGLAAGAGTPTWDDAGIARTRGELALRRGDAAGAAREARRALAVEHGWRAQARLHNLLGIAAATQGDLGAAVDAFEHELRASSAAGLETFVATTQANLAEAHLRRGDTAAAAGHQQIALTLAREQDQSVIVAFSLMVAARLALQSGDPGPALSLQLAADELLDEASYVLYDEDARLRAELLTAVRSARGDDAAGPRVAAVRLDTDAAADLAEAVLSSVASMRHDPEVGR